MTRRHTISTRTDTLCPITTLFRSAVRIDGTRFADQVRLVAPNVLGDDPGAHRDALAGDRWIEVLGIVPRVGHAKLLPVLAIEQICRMTRCNGRIGSARIIDDPPIVGDHLLGHDVIHRAEILADGDFTPRLRYVNVRSEEHTSELQSLMRISY